MIHIGGLPPLRTRLAIGFGRVFTPPDEQAAGSGTGAKGSIKQRRGNEGAAFHPHRRTRCAASMRLHQKCAVIAPYRSAR
jgi:hypothetical protein